MLYKNKKSLCLKHVIDLFLIIKGLKQAYSKMMIVTQSVFGWPVGVLY